MILKHCIKQKKKQYLWPDFLIKMVLLVVLILLLKIDFFLVHRMVSYVMIDKNWSYYRSHIWFSGFLNVNSLPIQSGVRALEMYFKAHSAYLLLTIWFDHILNSLEKCNIINFIIFYKYIYFFILYYINTGRYN